MHPYPAMVADELALSLARRFVKPNNSVLDPFCGSGRLLVAAARVPGERVGVDINPLACLLTRAKLANPNVAILSEVLQFAELPQKWVGSHKLISLREHRKVEWFQPAVIEELGHIIHWINNLKLDRPEKLIVAAALSAASRDVSFARKDGWKLHRLALDQRTAFSLSAWDAFEKRLRYCISEIVRQPTFRVASDVRLGDARCLQSILGKDTRFDVVLTSPPYGDSRTTVQYGAASALCLEFVSQIRGLEDLFVAGSEIDATCLGGSNILPAKTAGGGLRRYWAGREGTRYSRSVSRFLEDYGRVCDGIANSLKSGGTAVIVVGQRSTGGFRLKLDRFTIDQLEARGLKMISTEERHFSAKRAPRMINRYARSGSAILRRNGLTPTMSREIIIVFRKAAGRSL
jgi:site-specific DNA-methyltransferase (cytosine-N4-specific)